MFFSNFSCSTVSFSSFIFDDSQFVSVPQTDLVTRQHVEHFASPHDSYRMFKAYVCLICQNTPDNNGHALTYITSFQRLSKSNATKSKHNCIIVFMRIMHIHALFSLFQSTTRALTTVASANISTTALIYKFHSVFLSTHQTVTSRKFQRSQKYFSITLRIVATKRRLHKSQRFTDMRVL